MKHQQRPFLIQIGLLFILLISIYSASQISNGLAAPASVERPYYELFRLEKGSSRFYVAHLNDSETWSLNVTAKYTGVFHIFMFDERPLQNYLQDNGSINPEIYNQAIAYNTTPSIFNNTLTNLLVSTVSLDYTYNSTGNTPSADKLLYIQISIVENGPDSFALYSSTAVQAYYIPFIPAYPITSLFSVLIGSIFLQIGVTSYARRKRTHEKRN